MVPTRPALASSGGLDAVIRLMVDKPLASAGIMAGAFIVNKLARRVVKLLVRRLGRRRVQRGRVSSGVTRQHRFWTPARR
jgi:hypothetical protein